MTAQPDLFDALTATYCPPVDIPPVLPKFWSDTDRKPTRTVENSELARQAQIAAAVRRNGGPPIKFRNPATGESWTGRGLKPAWLLMAIEDGKTLEDFAV